MRATFSAVNSTLRSDVVFGLIPTPELGAEIRVTIIATGFVESPPNRPARTQALKRA